MKKPQTVQPQFRLRGVHSHLIEEGVKRRSQIREEPERGVACLVAIRISDRERIRGILRIRDALRDAGRNEVVVVYST